MTTEPDRRSLSSGLRIRIARSKIIVLVLSIGTLAVGAGMALAQIPGPGGVINGCYTKSTGGIRIIDSAASCKSGETSLNWNQTGPAGATGAQGAKGDAGAIGPAGPQGDAGPAGPKGDIGPAGPTGDTGPKGDQGAPGADGATGPVGPQGEQGPQGPAGPTGTLSSVRVEGPMVVLQNSGDSGASVANCPAGSIVSGGGFFTSGVTIDASRQAPAPFAAAAVNGWYVSGLNVGDGVGEFEPGRPA